MLVGLPGSKNEKDKFGHQQFHIGLFSKNIVNFTLIFSNQASKGAIFVKNDQMAKPLFSGKQFQKAQMAVQIY